MRKHCSGPGPLAGQSVVEFALASLLLMTLLFGTIDLGRAVFDRAMLTNAVREAGRYAAVNPSDSTGIVAAAQARSPGLGLTAANFTIACATYDYSTSAWTTEACSAAQPADRVTVSVTYTFSFTAARLVGLSRITMRDQSQVGVQ